MNVAAVIALFLMALGSITTLLFVYPPRNRTIRTLG